MSENPFFNQTVQASCQAHLKADPANFVLLIVSGQFAVHALDIPTTSERSLKIRTQQGGLTIVDRNAILMIGLEGGRDLPEEIEAPEAAFSAEWMEAMSALRERASVSKDKAVLAAFQAMVAVEEAAMPAGSEGQGEAAAGEPQT